MTMELKLKQQDLMSSRLEKLRFHPNFYDIILVDIDNNKHFANKNVLAASSSYFYEKFKQLNNNHTLPVEEFKVPEVVTPKALELIITFTYSGILDVSDNDTKVLQELLIAAEALKYKPIYQHCTKLLLDSLTPQNFSRYWLYAEKSNNDQMKLDIIKMMTTNLKAIYNSPDVSNVSENCLLQLLRQVNEFNQDEVLKLVINWTKKNVDDRLPWMDKFLEKISWKEVSTEFLRCILDYDEDDDLKARSPYLSGCVFNEIKERKKTEAIAFIKKQVLSQERTMGTAPIVVQNAVHSIRDTVRELNRLQGSLQCGGKPKSESEPSISKTLDLISQNLKILNEKISTSETIFAESEERSLVNELSSDCAKISSGNIIADETSKLYAGSGNKDVNSQQMDRKLIPEVVQNFMKSRIPVKKSSNRSDDGNRASTKSSTSSSRRSSFSKTFNSSQGPEFLFNAKSTKENSPQIYFGDFPEKQQIPNLVRTDFTDERKQRSSFQTPPHNKSQNSKPPTAPDSNMKIPRSVAQSTDPNVQMNLEYFSKLTSILTSSFKDSNCGQAEQIKELNTPKPQNLPVPIANNANNFSDGPSDKKDQKAGASSSAQFVKILDVIDRRNQKMNKICDSQSLSRNSNKIHPSWTSNAVVKKHSHNTGQISKASRSDYHGIKSSTNKSTISPISTTLKRNEIINRKAELNQGDSQLAKHLIVEKVHLDPSFSQLLSLLDTVETKNSTTIETIKNPSSKPLTSIFSEKKEEKLHVNKIKEISSAKMEAAVFQNNSFRLFNSMGDPTLPDLTSRLSTLPPAFEVVTIKVYDHETVIEIINTSEDVTGKIIEVKAITLPQEAAICPDKKKIYIVGGRSASLDVYSTFLSFDVVTRSWESLCDLSTPRYGAGATVMNDFIFAVGGMGREYEPLRSVEYYDPTQRKWFLTEPMRYERVKPAVCTYNNYIYVFGGEIKQNSEKKANFASCERYDMKLKYWNRLDTKLPIRSSIAENCFMTTVMKGKMFAIRASVCDEMWSLHQYDPRLNMWEEICVSKKHVGALIGIGSVKDEELCLIDVNGGIFRYKLKDKLNQIGIGNGGGPVSYAAVLD